MPALRDLQTGFRRALLADSSDADEDFVALIEGSEVDTRERLAVYRNNVFASLRDALRESFPVVCRLVGTRFFDYVAHEFIVAHPPARPALFEYGGAFPGFLAESPPCRELLYLADVARFEWAMNEAANAGDALAALPEMLAGVNPEDAARLVFELHPSRRYLASRYPIDRIWRTNQSDACTETIDLDAGGVRLEVSRQGNDVVFHTLDESNFIFRKALQEGACLGAALESALAASPAFPAGDALSVLFREGAVVGIARDSSDKEHAS